jgi:hypothetical protein
MGCCHPDINVSFQSGYGVRATLHAATDFTCHARYVTNAASRSLTVSSSKAPADGYSLLNSNEGIEARRSLAGTLESDPKLVGERMHARNASFVARTMSRTVSASTASGFVPKRQSANPIGTTKAQWSDPRVARRL